jgi:hypothetical protein
MVLFTIVSTGLPSLPSLLPLTFDGDDDEGDDDDDDDDEEAWMFMSLRMLSGMKSSTDPALQLANKRPPPDRAKSRPIRSPSLCLCCVSRLPAPDLFTTKLSVVADPLTDFTFISGDADSETALPISGSDDACRTVVVSVKLCETFSLSDPFTSWLALMSPVCERSVILFRPKRSK